MGKVQRQVVDVLVKLFLLGLFIAGVMAAILGFVTIVSWVLLFSM